MSRGPRRIGPYERKHPLRLSLCMIVKNEAETLERCLSLARPHVDEIVVVDTGSTDGTPEIARRYADVYDEIEWPDSFSLARNHSFDLATGDYILVLDGDEYIEGDEAWRNLHRALRQPELACLQIPVKNVLAPGQIVAADRIWQERVMRNHPRLRYSGRVHNQIQEAIQAFVAETGQRVLRADAEVVHTGYAHSPERMRQKYEPRLKLLRAEYYTPRSELYRAYYGYQLGVGYFVLHRYEEALEVLSEIDYRELSEQNAFYAHLLAAQCGLKLNQALPALAHCNHMLTLSRIEPVAYYSTGLALLLARKPGDGMLMLLEAFALNETAGTEVRFVMNPQSMLRILSRVCAQVGLPDHHRVFAVLADKPSYDRKLLHALLGTLRTGIVMAEHEVAAA